MGEDREGGKMIKEAYMQNAYKVPVGDSPSFEGGLFAPSEVHSHTEQWRPPVDEPLFAQRETHSQTDLSQADHTRADNGK